MEELSRRWPPPLLFFQRRCQGFNQSIIHILPRVPRQEIGELPGQCSILSSLYNRREGFVQFERLFHAKVKAAKD